MSYIKIRIAEDLINLETELRKNLDEMFRMISPRFNPCDQTLEPLIKIFMKLPGKGGFFSALAGGKGEVFCVD